MVCTYLIRTLLSGLLLFFRSAVVLLDELEKAHKVHQQAFDHSENNSLSFFGLGCRHDTSSNTR